MDLQLFANNASATLAADLPIGGLSAVVETGYGALFPQPSGNDWFIATLVKATGELEIIKCTTRTADTMTIVRAQEGTSEKAFSAGDVISMRWTKGSVAWLMSVTPLLDLANPSQGFIPTFGLNSTIDGEIDPLTLQEALPAGIETDIVNGITGYKKWSGDVLNAAIDTIIGGGSGGVVNADTLDGFDSSYFYSASNPPPAGGGAPSITGSTEGTVYLNASEYWTPAAGMYAFALEVPFSGSSGHKIETNAFGSWRSGTETLGGHGILITDGLNVRVQNLARGSGGGPSATNLYWRKFS